MLGDAMFYGSGAGKLPTASAVVADIVDMVKHNGTNVFIDWSSEKMELIDYKENVNRFFVRTTSEKQTVEAAFGAVEYVEGVVAGEMGFVTEAMTEAAFAEKVQKVECVSRIRLA
jgi:homoserine dehydrogenase